MKIAVVGAGPAGSFCAFRLAQAGIQVTQFDRHAQAWEKPCGGGVPPKVRIRFPEIAAYDGARQIINVGNFYSQGGIHVRMAGGNSLWVVHRKQFDGYLRELARQAGVRLIPERIKKVERDGKGFLLHGRRRRRFDFVVGADSALSVVRRDLLSPIPKKHICMTVGYFISGSSNEATTWFLPKPGYIWAFPRTDHICLGGGVNGDGLDMWPLIEQKKISHFAQAGILKKWAAPIPSVSDPAFYDRPVSGPGFAVVGDAAGHVDCLSGEGIYYALWSGHLLAQALIAERPGHYEQAWRDEYGMELRRASELFWTVYNPRTMEWVMRLAKRSRTLQDFFYFIMTEQPSYFDAGKDFKRRLPIVAWEVLKSLW